MRKFMVAAVVIGSLALGAAPALAAEHHPPKFRVHSTQCEKPNNHPNCPGKH